MYYIILRRKLAMNKLKEKIEVSLLSYVLFALINQGSVYCMRRRSCHTLLKMVCDPEILTLQIYVNLGAFYFNIH